MYFLPKTESEKDESEYKQTSPLSGCLLPQASLGGTPRERWASAQAPDNFKLTEIRLEVFVRTSFTWNLRSSYPSLGYAGRELMLLPTLNSCKQGSCTASGFIHPLGLVKETYVSNKGWKSCLGIIRNLFFSHSWIHGNKVPILRRLLITQRLCGHNSWKPCIYIFITTFKAHFVPWKTKMVHMSVRGVHKSLLSLKGSISSSTVTTTWLKQNAGWKY